MCLRCVFIAVGTFLMLAGSLSAQTAPYGTPGISETISLKPNYLSPSEIAGFLGVVMQGNKGVMEWTTAGRPHYAEIRYNDAANLILVSGSSVDVDFVNDLIREADIPPRQIEIEVMIFEVNKSKARDIGFDWERFWQQAGPRLSYRFDYRHDDDKIRRNDHQRYDRESIDDEYYSSNGSDRTSYRRVENIDDIMRNNFERSIRRSQDHDLAVHSSADLGEIIKILDENGAGTVRNVPRILTLNNRRATILDGQRVIYTTSYAEYASVFEVDTMDAGLNLSIVPSLGESGCITMDIIAELTSLGYTDRRGPIKIGQMVENTVIVKDGESVLLGGLTRTADESRTKRLPLLGHLIPFLFSREETYQVNFESIIILTPRVVDFETALDEQTRGILEGTTEMP